MVTTIIGVDFSGAQDEAKTDTWVAQGHLTSDGNLLFDSVQPARRDDLYGLLDTGVSPPAVVALDFPFGLPTQFATFLFPDWPPRTMPRLWHAVAGITSEEFVESRDRFVADYGEVQRAGDARYHPYPESFSPLHKVRPNMVPMTYEGINLLHRWHLGHTHRWHVPPLAPTAPPDKTITILELMPGAFLKAIGFDHATTKSPGYKTSIRAIHNRDAILGNLSEASGVPLCNLDTVLMGCRANDDCLDAVIAAVGAAAWALDSAYFHRPRLDELGDAQLEGWIYVPLSPASH